MLRVHGSGSVIISRPRVPSRLRSGSPRASRVHIRRISIRAAGLGWRVSPGPFVPEIVVLRAAHGLPRGVPLPFAADGRILESGPAPNRRGRRGDRGSPRLSRGPRPECKAHQVDGLGYGAGVVSRGSRGLGGGSGPAPSAARRLTDWREDVRLPERPPSTERQAKPGHWGRESSGGPL